jgi:TATA-binding protein-associated factor
MILNESPEEQRAAHYKWLEDVAIRILCVFALDKVGDFAFDQVVAPVGHYRLYNIIITIAF